MSDHSPVELAPFIRLWRALDDHRERVESTWWGAVVTDSRYPAIWDANYARVETTRPDLALHDVEAALRESLARIRAVNLHLVLFHPDELTELLGELGQRGHRLSWDAIMEHRGRVAPVPPGLDVQEVGRPDRAFWRRHRESMREFGITDETALEQLGRLERDLTLAGKRWFVIRDGRRIASIGSLIVLEGVGYIDNVVTFPEARGKGYAKAVVTHLVAESRAAGASRVYLLTERDGGPISFYERLGFANVAVLASSLGDVG